MEMGLSRRSRLSDIVAGVGTGLDAEGELKAEAEKNVAEK
jgi:hypothetical protein